MALEERYLVDTNVWLERLLGQSNSDVAGKFFDKIPSNRLFISDFSLHSIGVILTRYKYFDLFEDYIIGNYSPVSFCKGLKPFVAIVRHIRL